MYMLLIILSLITLTTSFHTYPSYPKSYINTQTSIKHKPFLTKTPTKLYIFGEDENAPKLTRENEPEEFFSAKMDSMSDAEKIPIALAGLAGISLPFVLGLVALYAAK